MSLQMVIESSFLRLTEVVFVQNNFIPL